MRLKEAAEHARQFTLFRERYEMQTASLKADCKLKLKISDIECEFVEKAVLFLPFLSSMHLFCRP